MHINSAKWSPNGQIIAVAGSSLETDNKGCVNFYSPNGNLLRTLKLPSNPLVSVCYEGNGLRLALAVDANLFFAMIKPEYRWT